MCQVNGPVLSFSHSRAQSCVVICYMKVVGTTKREQITKTLMCGGGFLRLEMLRSNGDVWIRFVTMRYKRWMDGRSGQIWFGCYVFIKWLQSNISMSLHSPSFPLSYPAV